MTKLLTLTMVIFAGVILCLAVFDDVGDEDD